MAKVLSIMIAGSICLLFGLQDELYAVSPLNPARMQEHIEKVKTKNPAQYQDMVDKAGGVVTNCVSCHVDMGKKKSPSNQTTPK